MFIPAWNEEEILPSVLAELAAGLPDADVLVVDDGSTDRTAELLGRFPRVEVARHPTNLGYGAGLWNASVPSASAIVPRPPCALR